MVVVVVVVLKMVVVEAWIRGTHVAVCLEGQRNGPHCDRPAKQRATCHVCLAMFGHVPPDGGSPTR